MLISFPEYLKPKIVDKIEENHYYVITRQVKLPGYNLIIDTGAIFKCRFNSFEDPYMEFPCKKDNVPISSYSVPDEVIRDSRSYLLDITELWRRTYDEHDIVELFKCVDFKSKI